jgi:hypothetical protein
MRLIPKQPRSIVAALLAIAVHVALALFLLFGVRWQNKSGEAMLVEVVPPPPVTKSVPRRSPWLRRPSRHRPPCCPGRPARQAARRAAAAVKAEPKLARRTWRVDIAMNARLERSASRKNARQGAVGQAEARAGPAGPGEARASC